MHSIHPFIMHLLREIKGYSFVLLMASGAIRDEIDLEVFRTIWEHFIWFSWALVMFWIQCKHLLG